MYVFGYNIKCIPYGLSCTIRKPLFYMITNSKTDLKMKHKLKSQIGETEKIFSVEDIMMANMFLTNNWATSPFAEFWFKVINMAFYFLLSMQ